MRKTRALRAAALLAATAIVTTATPVRADDPEDPYIYCLTACAAATGASGYVGEDAMWFYAGCFMGCLGRGLE